MINPGPCRPKHCGQQRFRVARRHVYDQILQAALGHGLQVIANRAHVNAIDEGRLPLQYMPGLADEFMQAAPGLLRFQARAAEDRPARR